MKLIIDSGSTKADWASIYSNGEVQNIKSQGLNPLFHTTESLKAIINEVVINSSEKITEIHFYGAGCSNAQSKIKIHDALMGSFDCDDIFIESDLLGAARACSGDTASVINILGTGSNSSYYDGCDLVQKNPSLGYILGDDGSGTHIGMELLKKRYKNDLNPVTGSLIDDMGSLQDHLESIYKKPFPNRYLASLARIAIENREHKEVSNIIYSCLESFFENQLSAYSDKKELLTYFVGGIASQCEIELRKLCDLYGFKFGAIIKRPINNLVKYHQLK